MTPQDTPPVQNPTWYADIRGLFTSDDQLHMQRQGIDLTAYADVVSSAPNIYLHVSHQTMPPGRPWPAGWVQTFNNWIQAKYPKGTPPPAEDPQPAPAARLEVTAQIQAGTRLRKEISQLSDGEVGLLKKAFAGIIAKQPNDPNSYFLQAAYHGLPNAYCMHHVPAYNPWHRAYLLSFENALRSVTGCENVTLPYWDITAPFPAVLGQSPFDQYVIPVDIGGGFAAGYTTSRNSPAEIKQNLIARDVSGDITFAMSKTDWEDFHGWWSGATNTAIIQAHDSAHVAIGQTMADQDVASFDPIFWFFHCNWDRLFWQWQKSVDGTNLADLLTTINKATDAASYQLFTSPAGMPLSPFDQAPLSLDASKTIDSLSSLGIDYESPQLAAQMGFTLKTTRSLLASSEFSVDPTKANVHVAGINRLAVPGSFNVHLLKDGKRIATKSLFQPREPEKCPTCITNALANFDFILPATTIAGGKLSVSIEPVDKSFIGDRFPQKLAGNPTIQVHLLMGTD